MRLIKSKERVADHHASAFSAEDSLLAHLDKCEIFTPIKTYPSVTMAELAEMERERA